MHCPDKPFANVFTQLNASLPRASILMGDFNAHNRLWASSAVKPNLKSYGQKVLDTLQDNDFTLSSQPGIPTRYPQSLLARPSTIDLVWSRQVEPLSVITINSATGSDHVSMLIVLDIRCQPPALPLQRIWKNADWKKINKDIAAHPTLLALPCSMPIPPFPLPQDSIFEVVTAVTQSLNEIADANVPTPKNLNRTKRWWSPKLTNSRNMLRQLFHAWQQNRSPATFNSYSETRKQYKKQISEAKRSHFA
jgi:hypothetical protein